jgi:hypothetical protein
MKTLRWLIVFAFAAVVAYQLLSTLLKADAVVKGATTLGPRRRERSLSNRGARLGRSAASGRA